METEQCIPLVLALDDASATLEQVGGKGASLARMAAAGLPIPAGFYITTAAYRRFVAENGLQEEIIAAVSTAKADDPASLEKASKQIEGLFADNRMPDDIAGEVRQAYAELDGGGQAVAVRSSATAEDLPDMSFAGQQETYLNMRGETQVLDAVKRCWSSLWTARAIGYRARNDIAPQDVSLAVVVQKLVPADAAGILFTANPLNGARDQTMINAAWGLGEAIVGGQVTPDTIVVDKASGTIRQQEISEKSIMTVRTSEGTREEAVPADKRTQAALSTAQATELVRISTQIEQLYGQPMDIEWAIHDGTISVVQARPITALPEAAGTPAAEWKLPDPHGRYARSSVIELLPDPLTPLFTGLGLPAWNYAYQKFGEEIGLEEMLFGNMMITINGYAYYDITAVTKQSFKVVIKLLGMISALRKSIAKAQERWEQEARPQYTEVVERWEKIDLRTTSAVRLLEGVREILKVAALHYLTIQSGILPSAYMGEALFTLVYDKLIKRRSDPPASTFMLGYNSTPIQAEKALYDLAQWARTQARLSDALQQMTAKQFVAAYQSEEAPEIGVEQEAWVEFRRRFTAYLTEFGHSIYDLDFAKAVPADDPASLLEPLKFFLSGKAPDPHARQEKAAAQREQATQATHARLRYGPRRAMFRKLIKWAQDLAPLREDGLAYAGLGWPLVRRMLREIGSRLALARAIDTEDDIFWLTADEVDKSAQELDDRQSLETYQAKVAERKATWKHESKTTPPVSLPLKAGVRFLGIDWSGFMPAQTEQKDEHVIKGVGASAGRVTGPARVIHGPEEFALMQQGDILVARITTPAWTPLFALASGVVTDVGGPLSHSSIVAREYHIPAVLGTGVATERLHNGQSITVDGDAGKVTVA